MASFGDIIVRLRAQTAKFDRGMKRSEKRLDAFEARVRSTGAALKQARGQILAGTAAVAGFALAMTSAAKDIDGTIKAARRLDIVPSQLRALEAASEKAGGSVEGLRRSVSIIAKTMTEASDGLAEARDAYDRLGLSVDQLSDQLNSGDIEGVLEAINRAALRLDLAERIDAIRAVAGRAGEELLLLGENVREAAKSNEAFAVISDPDRIEATVDALTDLRRAWTQFFGSLSEGEGTGVLANLAEILRLAAEQSRDQRGTGGQVQQESLGLFGIEARVQAEILKIENDRLKTAEGFRDVIAQRIAQQQEEAAAIQEAQALEEIRTRQAASFREQIAATGREIDPFVQKVRESKLLMEQQDLIIEEYLQKLERAAMAAENAVLDERAADITQSVATAAELYAQELERIAEVQERLSDETYARAVERARDAYLDTIPGASAVRQALRDLVTPQERFQEALEALNAFLEEGAITSDEYEKALKKLRERILGVEDASKDMTDATEAQTEAQKELNRTGIGTAQELFGGGAFTLSMPELAPGIQPAPVAAGGASPAMQPGGVPESMNEPRDVDWEAGEDVLKKILDLQEQLLDAAGQPVAIKFS